MWKPPGHHQRQARWVQGVSFLLIVCDVSSKTALSLAEGTPWTLSSRDWLELLDFKEEQSSFFEDYSHPVKDSERKIKHNKSMAIWTDKMHNVQDCIYFICSWKSQKIVHWCQNSRARSIASQAKWSVSITISFLFSSQTQNSNNAYTFSVLSPAKTCLKFHKLARALNVPIHRYLCNFHSYYLISVWKRRRVNAMQCMWLRKILWNILQLQ